jgi:hypothetical protein
MATVSDMETVFAMATVSAMETVFAMATVVTVAVKVSAAAVVSVDIINLWLSFMNKIGLFKCKYNLNCKNLSSFKSFFNLSKMVKQILTFFCKLFNLLLQRHSLTALSIKAKLRHSAHFCYLFTVMLSVVIPSTDVVQPSDRYSVVSPFELIEVCGKKSNM